MVSQLAIRFVLCQTTHPGNIGAAARAMQTMNLRELFLVNPRFFPHEQAVAMASGALEVLNSIQVVPSLSVALQGSQLVFGVTARVRELSHPMMSLRESVQWLHDQTGVETVAFVFGTEMSGLSNAELDSCHRLCHIPAAPDFSSLNLAAAVQVVAYELFQMNRGRTVMNPEFKLATHEEMEYFYEHLEEVLVTSRFMDPRHPGRLMTRLRRLFGRALVEKEEVSILRGMLRALTSMEPKE